MAVTSSLSSDQRTLTIKVGGRFDFSTHQDFMRSYKGFPKGQLCFVVDLSGVEYMDSSAMGILLQLREYGRPDANVELVNSNDAVSDLLRIANFDKLFKIA